MFTKALQQFSEHMNEYGKKREPFFFVVDFLCNEPRLFPLATLNQEDIFISFPNYTSQQEINNSYEKINIIKHPISFDAYQKSFTYVKNQIHYGNSYLVNLTAQTPIEIPQVANPLHTIYTTAKAKYKIKYKNDWVCFSPETFVEMNNQTIATYPMKGTIDASIPNAKELILQNAKEKAEHYTIVDLLRNDVSIVAKDVRVEKFRYIDEIKTAQKNLFQVSSKIVGQLPDHAHEQLGSIFCNLLPAGSISGAPKKRTMEIIQQAENYQRGFYTGVAGVYNGHKLDSCVLIRFIENTIQQGLVYKSGGGITINSDATNEYNELLDKIYIAS